MDPNSFGSLLRSVQRRSRDLINRKMVSRQLLVRGGTKHCSLPSMITERIGTWRFPRYFSIWLFRFSRKACRSGCLQQTSARFTELRKLLSRNGNLFASSIVKRYCFDSGANGLSSSICASRNKTARNLLNHFWLNSKFRVALLNPLSSIPSWFVFSKTRQNP